MLHFQRRENVLLDVLLERLPAHPLHDVTGDAHPVVGVCRNGSGWKYPLRLVADEEVASFGTSAVAERFRADAAIVTEPTELRLCLAHKGFVWLEVETLGLAAHGSRPDLGVDAIARMGRILTGLTDLDRHLRAGKGHVLLGSGDREKPLRYDLPVVLEPHKKTRTLRP